MASRPSLETVTVTVDDVHGGGSTLFSEQNCCAATCLESGRNWACGGLRHELLFATAKALKVVQQKASWRSILYRFVIGHYYSGIHK